MIKKYYLIFTLTLTAFLSASGQIKSKTQNDKKMIDPSGVNTIQIRNHAYESDSIPLITKKLTDKQAKFFIDRWNNSKSKGACIYMVRYWIDVTLKDGSKRIFRINGQSIKEKTDYCFDLGDDKYILNLWNEAK